MSVRYDPTMIRKYADMLYRHANSIIALACLIGVVVGALAFGIIGAIVLGVVGAAIGISIAFKFKLQAQVALCQVRIEENTRGARELAPATREETS